MSRRHFLQGVASVAAAGSGPALAATTALPAASNRARSLGGSFADQRSAVGTSFDAAMADWGVRTVALPTDPYGVWQRHMAQARTGQPQAIAGFSNLGTLFCLERLGWEMGLRASLRIEHLPLSGGRWHHVTHGALPDWAAPLLDNAAGDFGLAAARIALEATGCGSDLTHAAPARHDSAIGDAFVTWILSPITTA